jgi:hypothetical protein
MLAAVLLRMDSFGDPVAHSVDQFYLLVGERMHRGLLPYADIWDRKPPGIFFLYYLFATISTSAACYQIAASVFAGATASIVAWISNRWASRTSSILAGIVYLFMLGDFNGNTGEAEVFRNLFVAAAAYWLMGPARRASFDWAILCLGLALTIKQTVAIEASIMGVFALYRLGRDNWHGNALRFILIGAAPTLAFGVFFLLAGHFDQYWQATVESIFIKGAPSSADVLGRSLDLGRRLIPLIALTAIAFGLKATAFSSFRSFMLVWIVGAAAGVVAVPQLYLHYGLPLVLPLAIVASVAFDRGIAGAALAVLAVLASLIYHRPFEFERHAQSRVEMAALADAISALPGDTMLVFDGPTALYTLTGRRFLTPLVFPPHLNHKIELDVSGIDTNREIRRVLLQAPAVIVMTEQPRNQPANEPGWQQIRDFTRARCRLAFSAVTHEMGRQRLLVFDCSEARLSKPSPASE